MAFDEMTATAMREAARYERRIAELETALRDLLEHNDAVYQTEYDGRMLTCCIGCDADLAASEHKKDCPVIRAQAALAAGAPEASAPRASAPLRPTRPARRAEQLAREVAEGGAFPRLFASTEY